MAVSGSGRLGTITFTGTNAGPFNVTITGSVLSDRDGMKLPHTVAELPLTVCGFATVSGKISLQGRATPIDEGSVTLTDTTAGSTFGPYTANFSATDGTWTINDIKVLPTGSDYKFAAAHGLYLTNEKTETLDPLENLTNQNTRLLGGDANNDGRVGPGDLSCIGGSFGGSPVGSCTGGSSDINADGLINIQDLSIAGGNYDKHSPLGW